MSRIFDKKVVAIIAAVVLALSVVGASVAYLRDSTGTVDNVFTVGDKLSVSLDEAVVDEFGVASDPFNNRTAGGNTYRLLPGVTYTKDPVMHVAGGSEKCYVYMKVEYQSAYASVIGKDSIDAQILANGWACMKSYSSGDYDVAIYARLSPVDASSVDVDCPFFSSFTVPADIAVDSPVFQAARGESLKLTGYAVQAAGFNSAEAAWEAAGF